MADEKKPKSEKPKQVPVFDWITRKVKLEDIDSEEYADLMDTSDYETVSTEEFTQASLAQLKNEQDKS